MRTVLVSIKAHRQIGKLPRQDQPAIYDALDVLAHWPDCRGVKALSGRSGYRQRVGDYRILFEVEGEVVKVMEVRRRNERTYA